MLRGRRKNMCIAKRKALRETGRGAVIDGMGGKRPRYRELIADNGLSSGARA